MKQVCGDCQHFAVLNCAPDGPEYVCLSRDTKEMSPGICRLRGPDAPGCKFFALINLTAAGPYDPATDQKYWAKKFVDSPELFIDAKTAAHLLRKQQKTIYTLVEKGTLKSVRVCGTIWIYKPSLLDIIESSAAD